MIIRTHHRAQSVAVKPKQVETPIKVEPVDEPIKEVKIPKKKTSKIPVEEKVAKILNEIEEEVKEQEENTLN